MVDELLEGNSPAYSKLSGKSTTLDAIAGLTTVTHGKVTVSGSQGIGFCPQRNVLFKECTVEENVSIFNRLKSIESVASKVENHELIKACDLDRKIGARVSSLSGGQMRESHQVLVLVSIEIDCFTRKASIVLDVYWRQPCVFGKCSSLLGYSFSWHNRSMSAAVV